MKWPKNLYALIGLTAAIGVVSGIGATCTTFFDVWWRMTNAKGGYTFGPVGDNQLIFVICYFVTWLVALAWSRISCVKISSYCLFPPTSFSSIFLTSLTKNALIL